jgi:hypothetical protein
MVGIGWIAHRAGHARVAVAGIGPAAEAFPRSIGVAFAHPAGVVADDAHGGDTPARRDGIQVPASNPFPHEARDFRRRIAHGPDITGKCFDLSQSFGGSNPLVSAHFLAPRSAVARPAATCHPNAGAANDRFPDSTNPSCAPVRSQPVESTVTNADSGRTSVLGANRTRCDGRE